MGNGVHPASLTAARATGRGRDHSIYGVPGPEARFIPFLSPGCVRMPRPLLDEASEARGFA